MTVITRIQSFAFSGIEAVPVEVQVQISSGLPAFLVVGLPDKAVGEARERVRAALTAMGLSLPPKRVLINLAPADLLKEGSHFDLPIALAVLGAMEVVPREDIGRLRGARRAVARRIAQSGRRACCPRPSAPPARELGLICAGRPGRRGGVGRAHRGAGGLRPARPHQPFPRRARCSTRRSRRRWRRPAPARSRRREGHGDRAAGARDRGGRRP